MPRPTSSHRRQIGQTRRLWVCVGIAVLGVSATFGCASPGEHTVAIPSRQSTAASSDTPGDARAVKFTRFDDAADSSSQRHAVVRPASHLQPTDPPLPPVDANSLPKRIEDVPAPLDVAAPEPNRRDPYPIDLPTALQLALGQNPQVAFAQERVAAATARLDAARVQWLPNLYIAPSWTRHDGRIQDTRGEVIDVSRSALFSGGGARLQVATAEAYFAPLAARQVRAARMAGSLATNNDTLRDVSLAYWTLVNARGRQVILRETEANTHLLDELAQAYLRAEKLKPADADRVRAQLLARRQETELTMPHVRIASARLARWIRLDPFVELVPADEQAVPVEYFSESLANVDLATTALSNRPELAEQRAFVGAAIAKLREARFGPILPSLVIDVSAGGFGGGPNGFFGGFDGRSDVAAAAVWEFENLGLGDRARIRERAAEVRQAEMRTLAVMDQVVTDAAEAAAQVAARRRQLDLARQAVAAATNSYERNLALFTDSGIELILPLEVLQSITAMNDARLAYLEAVIEYNKAQVQLHWAIGSPINGIAAP